MMTVRQDAFNATILNMNRTGKRANKAAHKAIKAAGKVLFRWTKHNMNFQGRTLAQLAAEGHPYARRHGSIQIYSGTKLKYLPRGELRVHSQTGSLIGALRGSSQGGSTATYRLALDTNTAPHAVYVIRGTRVMLGRDVLWEGAVSPNMQRELRKAVIKVLGPELRTQGSIRFGPVGSGS